MSEGPPREPVATSLDAVLRGVAPLSSEAKRRVRLAEGQRKGFETAWNEYFDCYAATTYVVEPLIRLEDIAYHLYLKKNINPHNPRWELPSFRQLKKTLGLSQDKLQGIEARLSRAGLLVKESGKGRGAKGENVANDYLLFEPLELADFLLAVDAGQLPGALNEKGQRRLADLRVRFSPTAPPPTHSDHSAQPTIPATPVPVPPTGTPRLRLLRQAVPESATPAVPVNGAASAPAGGAPVVPDSGAVNRPSPTALSQQTKEQQQPRAAESAAAVTPEMVAGVNDEHTADPAPAAAIAALVDRGIDATAAAHLCRTAPAERIERQIAAFDYLRDERPGDPRLTPGRLRRQIEQDWSPPPGYQPPAAREAAAAAAARESAARRAALASATEQATSAATAREAFLAAIGLTSADQAVWTRLAQQSPPLPALWREALFHAPRGGESAALIFRDRAALDRATGPAHRGTRALAATRVGAEYTGTRHARIHYLLYDDVVRLLAR